MQEESRRGTYPVPDDDEDDDDLPQFATIYNSFHSLWSVCGLISQIIRRWRSSGD